MNKQDWVKISNRCPETIRVFLRYPRPKKQSVQRPESIDVDPGKTSRAFPLNVLVGGQNWDKLIARDCVQIENVPFEPRFLMIANLSTETMQFNVRPVYKKPLKMKAQLAVKPGETSRPVDVRSLPQRKQIDRLAKEGKLELIQVNKIGPPIRHGRSVGSFGDDDVYICYKCGGPIVFRGSPPTPVHI